MLNQTLNNYLAELAAKKHVPGGGFAAAISAAQACALFEMAMNYSNFTSTDINEITIFRQNFLELANADMQAFDLVMQSYSLSKKNDEQKLYRKEQIQLSSKQACDVPLKTIAKAVKLVQVMSKYTSEFNKNIISDAAIAYIQINACVQSSKYNVNINLKTIKDTNYSKKALLKLDTDLNLIANIVTNSTNSINEIINK